MINWLTGFDDKKINELIINKVNFEIFFKNAKLSPNSKFIKGTIFGCKIEEIENPLTKKVRYLDKLVDELAKGKKVENF